MNISENWHMTIHFGFGLFASITVYLLFPTSNFITILLIGLAMSLIPDIDHLFYFYIYARDTRYSKKVRKLFKKRGVSKTIDYTKKHHKKNTGVYSHSIPFCLMLLGIAVYYMFYNPNPILAILFFSWSLHYVYDIFEDALFFGELNPNWFLNFNKKR